MAICVADCRNLHGKLRNNPHQHSFNKVGVRVFVLNFCTGDTMRGAQLICFIQTRIATRARLNKGGGFFGEGDLQVAQNLDTKACKK